MAPTSIAIVGCSGQVGSATTRFLASRPGISIKAGTRNPNHDGLTKLRKDCPSVEFVAADMNKPSSLETVLRGADAVAIITPGQAANAGELCINVIDKAKAAKAKFILLISGSIAETDSAFGHLILPVEKHLIASGLKYCILRPGFFLENLFGHIETIKGMGQVFGDNNPDSEFAVIAVDDIATTAAEVLANYQDHQNSIINLTGEVTTYKKIAADASLALGRKVEYVQVPTAAVKQALVDLQMYEEWVIDAMLEYGKQIDLGEKSVKLPSAEMKAVIKTEPITTKDWFARVRAVFES
eukprot:m.24272 g.24272  ORF g.24272 m.24272 type:complete len:298 (+) comp11487_c0_seq1:134-1027(+)